ncbi:hypothetical protein HHK36_005250 [Tetracentron sinense]|uniref:MLO-like protein n=1 Tax=Tetracentron sinense TaxID=13715 RepID=A0A834ZTU0_TETSI|nr:hypothetical protein HHK36_005250 [Tetracentron sinense]
MAGEEVASLEETPTWAVAVVCFILITISLIIEHALHHLTKYFRRKRRKSLTRALYKMKSELMLLGFISLLLSVSQKPVAKICIPKSVAETFLPCKNTTLPSEFEEEPRCEEQGKVSLLSREGVKQLHYLIFVLAFFHVLSCVLTFGLGMVKMKRWESWEEETRTLEYLYSNDPRRFRLTHQTSFGKRHLNCWSDHHLLRWPACFLRQFIGSVSKVDYFTLRHGFIMAHFAEGSKFDFRKFLRRALDDDFQVVVGVSLPNWIFFVFFIFFNARGFYNYLWLPFIPLVILLLVGTKVQAIITIMCLESHDRDPVVRGTLLVKPNDNLFWFGRPQLLLHLMHFILFQNSFQLAFFTWTWYKFGFRSCFHRRTEDIIIRIAMGVIVQFLCGYVTLPLYALVTQMGSSMKAAVFTERVVKGLKNWRATAKRNLVPKNTNWIRHSLDTSLETSTSYTVDTSLSDGHEVEVADFDHSSLDLGYPDIEIMEEKKVEPKTNIGGTYNELMILGFISLLLTVSEVPISKICVTEAVANSFLPCKDPFDIEEAVVSSETQISRSNATLSTEITDESSCEAKGMVSLLTREGVKQLHIFIFVLAIFHVLYCVLTMFLGTAKMKRWKAWEEETRTLEYQIDNDPRRFRLTRQTSFGRRHLKFWSEEPLLLWPVCFLRQFGGSISKSDYFTLRNGFIVAHFAEGSNFDFQKFLTRAFDDDFEVVVGISAHGENLFSFIIFTLADYIMVLLFVPNRLVLDLPAVFYNHFWLPFIPLVIVLIVGTKLEVIITKMCLESRDKTTVVRGTFLVKPNDNFFWFGRPQWLLHLIQFILFQYEYGLKSCFNRETKDIALKITMGVIVQFLCGYVTLPLYALVTQMGSGMKTAVFTERVAKGLIHWHNLARRNLSRNRSTSTRHSSEPWPTDTTETSFGDMQELCLPEYDHLPAVTSSPSSPEITEQTLQHNHLPPPAVMSFPTIENAKETAQDKIITRGTYDGEISFGTSWKELGSGKGSGDITSVVAETASEILNN